MLKKIYPAAQFPLVVPPLLAHSLPVKQVPLRTVLKTKQNISLSYGTIVKKTHFKACAWWCDFGEKLTQLVKLVDMLVLICLEGLFEKL